MSIKVTIYRNEILVPWGLGIVSNFFSEYHFLSPFISFIVLPTNILDVDNIINQTKL